MAANGSFSIKHLGDASLVVELSGDWHLARSLPSPEAVNREIASAHVSRVNLVGENLGRWDSGLLIFLKSIADICRSRNVNLDLHSLPPGVARLVNLSEAVPERKGARSDEK